MRCAPCCGRSRNRRAVITDSCVENDRIDMERDHDTLSPGRAFLIEFATILYEDDAQSLNLVVI